MQRSACSLVIPVFNGSKYLSKSISGIVQMAGQNDEILIINDGSTDVDMNYWSQLQAIDSRINVIHKNHEGIVSALNTGFAQAKNLFIARMDVDDSCKPERIDLQIKEIIRNPDVGVVFCDYEFVDLNSKDRLGSIPTAVFSNASLLSMVNPQRMPHPGALISKEKFLEVGGYSTQDSPCEDYGLWLRIAEKYSIVSVPEILLEYSISPKSLTSLNAEEMSTRVDKLRNLILPSILERVSDREVVDDFLNYGSLSNGIDRQILLFRDLMILLFKKIRIYRISTYLRLAAHLFLHSGRVIIAVKDIRSSQIARRNTRLQLR